MTLRDKRGSLGADIQSLPQASMPPRQPRNHFDHGVINQSQWHPKKATFLWRSAIMFQQGCDLKHSIIALKHSHALIIAHFNMPATSTDTFGWLEVAKVACVPGRFFPKWGTPLLPSVIYGGVCKLKPWLSGFLHFSFRTNCTEEPKITVLQLAVLFFDIKWTWQ